MCEYKLRSKGNRSKRSDWWGEEIRVMIRRKRVPFEEFLRNRSAEKWENYKVKCREVKRRVKEGKRRAKERWSNRVEEYSRLNSKKFWREVNSVRIKKEKESWGIRNSEGEVMMG